ncbi:MAG: magnesium and cobalt transport protein CorA [Shackletoniella antarctica]|uniref:Magnesium transport protein CorA n=1 Tax=Shackletoniella antarctica TaxID=268115 RepID=A0A2W4WK24_9CYAN|nr:MAG: magnesium and cobalt transport protein CorA [Shackletoniella antarctica]
MSRRTPNPGGNPSSSTDRADQPGAKPADAEALRAAASNTLNASPHEVRKKLIDFNYSTPGTLPGALNIPDDALPTELYLMNYSPFDVHTATIDHPMECEVLGRPKSVTWLDARGLGSETTLLQIGQTFDLHPLMLEDIVNVPHRPKVDFYDDKILIIMQMVQPKKTGSGVGSEQVSFVMGNGFLVTFQEEPEWDSFNPVRDRIRRGTGTIRTQGSDYLAYALLDTIVDSFFPVLEAIGETLEDLEEEVVANPTNATIKKIHRMRRALMKLRRHIWPQRSVINSLIRDSDELISQEVRVYLQDVYDHIVQVVDIIENYREIASSLMDVYLSSINNRMNEVMKLLTVISSIFIPLTFIAGVYGMNFNTERSPFNMPELDWYWGYVLCLAVMAVIAAAQIYLFWKRGWFDNFSTTKR